MCEVKSFEGVPGVPEGWELIAVRKVQIGEWTVNRNGDLEKWKFNSSGIYPVIRKVPKGLKLEVGKCYRQKSGNVVGPICHDGGNDNWPFYKNTINREDRQYFSVQGYRYPHLDKNHPENLVEEVPKPEPKYRAFASAEEFKPYRDKWILRLDEEDGTSCGSYGAWRVDSYDEESVISDEEISYEELLKYKFEDGTPCGILTNP